MARWRGSGADDEAWDGIGDNGDDEGDVDGKDNVAAAADA